MFETPPLRRCITSDGNTWGGEGVARNEAEARKWFERSAQGGYAKAAEQLAQMPAPNN
jgi:TPR repeat protein